MVFDGTYCDLKVLSTQSPSKGSLLVRRAVAAGLRSRPPRSAPGAGRAPRGAARDDSLFFAASALSSL